MINFGYNYVNLNKDLKLVNSPKISASDFCFNLTWYLKFEKENITCLSPIHPNIFEIDFLSIYYINFKLKVTVCNQLKIGKLFFANIF